MVKYDFKCNHCKKKFVVEAHMGEEIHPTCPKCGASKSAVRIFVPTDFYFHGGYLETQIKPHNIKIDPRSIE